MIDYLLLLLQIPIHELGHFIGFIIFGIVPRFRVTWWLAIFIGEKESLKLRAWQLYFVSWLGILSGLLFLILFNVSVSTYLIYFIMCCFDFITIFSVLSLKRGRANMFVYRVQKYEAMDILKNFKNEVAR